MNWENVEPQTTQMMTQLLHLQMQLVNNAPTNTDPKELIGALGDYINQIGAEMQRQATTV
jgi:hypothetical protein